MVGAVAAPGKGRLKMLLRQSVLDQASMVRLFWSDRRLRAPVVAIWVASFGGALHEPVTTFFIRGLGATNLQMGKFGVIRTVGALVLGPVYGWLIDRYTAFFPALLSGLVCAVGCALRGFTPIGQIELLYAAAVVLGMGAANFWNVVGTHLVCATEPEVRSLVVGAYAVQVNTLELFGKSAYPFWDAGLQATGLDDRMLRYRITMSVCTFFCIFGVINLAFNGHAMKDVKAKESGQHSKVQPQDQGEGQTTKTVSSDKDYGTFVVASLVLVLQSAGRTAAMVLWPLYIQAQFSWQDHEYAWLSFAGTSASIVVTSGMPALAQQLGGAAVATILCGVSAAAAFIGFPAQVGIGAHLLGSVVFMGATAALKPCLEALASIAMPESLQGRAFALLSICNAAGQMLGNYVGTRLFDLSISMTVLPWVPAIVQVGGGALPFLVVGASLFLSTSVLAIALLPTQRRDTSAEKAKSPPSDISQQAEATKDSQDAEQELVSLLRRNAKAARASLAE